MDEKKILRPIEEMMERLTVAATFGTPVKEGDATLIPVASVTYGFGYGYGSGGPQGAAEAGTEADKPGGSGVGAGGGGMAKPLGFIRIDTEGVKYEPLLDPAKESIAGILLSAWSVFWIAKTIRAFVRR